jgi:serine/threonine protein kinase
MSLTLHIKGGPATEGAQSGLHRLKDSEAGDAKHILEQLRVKFEGKTGVVRLMHTTKANRNMKFSDAGGFKQMFISGSKLETTGRVIAQLMEGSGDFTPSEIKAFKDYASDRGERGIESRQLAAYLTPLKQATYATSEEALQALGVTVKKTLGQGVQGSVSQVMVKGQPAALKTFSNAEILGLDKTDGMQVGQAPKDEYGLPGNVNAGAQLKMPNQFKIGKIEEEDPDDTEDSDEDEGNAIPAMNKYGMDNATFDYKAEFDDRPEPAASDSPKTEIKLARTPGIGSVARMKDLDQVVQPSHYLITETLADSKSRVHVVQGNRALKNWIKTQSPYSKFGVAQYLMPLAAGKQLLAIKGRSAELNFKRQDLPDIARSMASLLEKMWQHGFIDGDMKPENLMWDPASKTLRAIDIDSFQKMSKKGGAFPRLGVQTPAFTHPNAIRFSKSPAKQPTLGRDLFSAGMVILEAALRSGGHGDEADRITLADAGENVEAKRQLSATTLPTTLDAMKKDLNLANGGVEDFAMLCIKTALKYEENRLAQGINRFERYDENAGPDHPMSILKPHPLMNPVE